jgi:hypothetical protein
LAFVIADLDSQHEPLPGESEIRIGLARSEIGYRLKAVTVDGRDVGRWVSDCPLTVTLHAMLWLGQSKWVIKQAKDSMPLQKILDEVPSMAPRGAHPQQAIDILRMNFPPKPTESDVTGAQIDLAVANSEPEVVMPARRALPGPVDPGPSVELHLRDSIRALKALISDKSASGFERPIISLLLNLGVKQIPPYGGLDRSIAVKVVNGLISELKKIKSGVPSSEVVSSILAGLGATGDSSDSADPDADLLAEIHEDPAPRAPGYRPLLPGEFPSGLSPDQVAELEAMTVDDPSVRAKLERTHSRAIRERERVERALAARAAAQAQVQVQSQLVQVQSGSPALPPPAPPEAASEEAGSAPDEDEVHVDPDADIVLRSPQA